jgi:hypothetical protein
MRNEGITMNKKMIYLAGLLLAVVSIAACNALPQAGNSVGTSSGSAGGDNALAVHTISVSGQGTASLVPDIASISIGVQTEDEVAAEAVAANNIQSELVVEVLETYGVASQDIGTTNFSVYPIQNLDNRGEETGTTFRVQNTVNVTVRNLDDLGAILDAVVSAGANTINEIRFETNDVARRIAVDEALAMAMADARRQADLTADAAGVRIVNVVTVNVTTFAGPAPYLDLSAAEGMFPSRPTRRS